MKVFVLGATGYIGGAVAEKLLIAGHEVLGLSRSEKSDDQLRQKGVEPVRGDLAEPESLVDPAREADAVAQIAQPRFDYQRDYAAQMREMCNVMRGATEALVGALDGTGKTLIFTGGTGAYGGTGDQIADEETPVKKSPRTAGLAESERRVLEAAGLRGLATRPAIVHGRGGGLIDGAVREARQTGRVMQIGTGNNLLSFVHVDDLADLYRLMLDKQPAAGTLLVVADEPYVSQKALLRSLSLAAGLGGEVQQMPVEPAQDTGYGGGIMFAGSLRVSAAKARDLLGWKPHHPTVLEELEYRSYRQPISERI